MGVLVSIETSSGERTAGLLRVDTIEQPEWHAEVYEVPRLALFSYGDLVALDAADATLPSPDALRFLRVVTRGEYQPSLRVRHTLADDDAVDSWLTELERGEWGARDDRDGVVWLAAPVGIDAPAVLARFEWVTEFAPG